MKAAKQMKQNVLVAVFNQKRVKRLVRRKDRTFESV